MRIDPILSDAVRAGALRLEGARIRARDDGVAGELTRLAQRLRTAYGDYAIGSVPGTEEARQLYRALGIDPTRTRPSSEALLRRALKGQPLPAVNAAVDVANLVSLEALLPVGLYDAGRIEGEVELRLGRPGEGYEGIRKDRVHLEGRIALCDARGPFGNPTSDSSRTMVTAATERLLFVVYAPRGLDDARLEAALRDAEERFRRHVGARVAASLSV